MACRIDPRYAYGVAEANLKALGMVLLCVLSVSQPAAAQGKSTARQSSWVHPGLAVGVGLGWATAVTACTTRGVFGCPLPKKHERSLGFQAAPAFDALLMFGKPTRAGTLRVGLGVRYVPDLLLDTGDELHFALIPEAYGELARDLDITFRFFNTVGKTFPGHGLRDEQAPVLAACSATSGVADARCRARAGTLLMTMSMDLGLVQRFDGYAVRYQIGIGGSLYHNDAKASAWTGSRSDDSDDELYATFTTKSTRILTSIGIEW